MELKFLNDTICTKFWPPQVQILRATHHYPIHPGHYIPNIPDISVSRSAVMKIFNFFRLSGKPFKMMKNTTTWPQGTWNVNIYTLGWKVCKNVQLAKMTLFRQVRRHENLQFFLLSGKRFKMMKNTTTWPQDTWNVNIFSFGWENMQKCEISKNDTFSTSPRSWKCSLLSTLWKTF